MLHLLLRSDVVLDGDADSVQATNCAAPDTGNMEVIAKYGSDFQKRKWLDPLLEGKIRSAFLMTEPQVASSDATNIEMTIKRDGDSYVLNGQVSYPSLASHPRSSMLISEQKWWSSGIGDPRCEVYIVLGKTDAGNADKYKQQSVILVPHTAPGITIHRMLSVFGYDDAPHGHGHVSFNNVRVPAANMVLGEGKGFEIIQGRLGPGRIHHAMRSIGSAEKALEWFLARINDEKKKPFGEMLHKHGVMLERVARSRIEIDAGRLAVLNAAITIDELNAKGALKEIAEVKVLVPALNLKVIDWAIQAYGGAGVSQDTPLASMYASGRTMRIVDGPDEVHLLQLGKNENKRGPAHKKRIEAQTKKGLELCKKYGIQARDPLHLNRKSAEPSKL
jgi:acyl-CoA dehydrogenase